MKKIIALLLALVMVFALAACRCGQQDACRHEGCHFFPVYHVLKPPNLIHYITDAMWEQEEIPVNPG